MAKAELKIFYNAPVMKSWFIDHKILRLMKSRILGVMQQDEVCYSFQPVPNGTDSATGSVARIPL